MKICNDCKGKNIATKFEWHYDYVEKKKSGRKAHIKTEILICGTCGCEDIVDKKGQ